MPSASWILEQMGGQMTQYDIYVDEEVVKEVCKDPIDEEEKTADESEISSDSSTTGPSLSINQHHQEGSIVHAGGFEDSKVRFDLDATALHTCPGRHEMSLSDFRDVWYLPSDFQSINAWNRMTVKVFRQHEQQMGDEVEKIDIGDHCIRGLEHRLKGRKEARRDMSIHAIYSVLQLQAIQKREGKGSDVQALADIYKQHTHVALDSAIEKAKLDVEAAKDEVEQPSEDGSAQQDQPRRRQGRRRSSLGFGRRTFFDDNDVTSLQEDVTSVPGTTDKKMASTIASPEEDSFKVKAKREKRGSISFSRIFKKKSSKSSSSSQKDKCNSRQPKSITTTDAPPFRRSRRSSMF